MPDFPPAVAVELEGDYSDYTLKWTTIGFTTAYGYPTHRSQFSGDEAILLFCDIDSTLAIIRVSDGTIISENINWAYAFLSQQIASESVLGKYMAIVDDSEDHLRIFKDGVLLKTVTIEAGDDFFGAIISKTGKYVALSYWDSSEGAYRMRCYEGS